MANNHIDVNVDKNSQCDAITTHWHEHDPNS